MNKALSMRQVILNLLCIGAFLSSGFTSITEGYWGRQLLKYGKMNLLVDVVVQSKLTSCGEAAIVMTYNYAHPETRLNERSVIEYAVEQGYYTERKFPYTSPENMVKIAQHYADTVSTGTVDDADEALTLLIDKLTGSNPVIIDIRTLLYDPNSGAHFVVVTGLEIDPDNPHTTKIYYNDPLLNKNRSSYWHGSEGIWDAWKNNRDPGGSGWWMMIYSP
jgi:hypothetical protein